MIRSASPSTKNANAAKKVSSPSHRGNIVNNKDDATGSSSIRNVTRSPKVFSVTKTITSLRSQPANRSCADCRSALVDPSSVYASFCPSSARNYNSSTSDSCHTLSGPAKIPVSFHDFRLNHHSFAPPDVKQKRRRKVDDVDPTVVANQTFGGHGVFICKHCAEAHHQLGSTITVVLPVMNISLWTAEQAQFMSDSGTNAQNWRVYEAYVPDIWKQRRPISSSNLSERLLFCKAKYEALAFALPPPGPLAEKAWPLVVQHNKIGQKFASADLKNIHALSPAQAMCQPIKVARRSNGIKDGLPNRLVDYFCVVSCSMQMLPSDLEKDLSHLSSPEDLIFWPHASDCFPDKDTHNDMEFPEHLPSFVMPGGCRPCLHHKPPTFFSFVLTLADGERLYGGALHIYDENMDIDELKQAVRNSGYKGALPTCLTDAQHDTDVVFFPKCLVVLSHHGFFDLFRSVLLELYQITLMAAPLPIERYIANFACEVPLPPQGKVKVEFAFTTDKKFVVERPPINQLPMANFSFRPLFASLSVSNIIVVLGCLLEERKVVLLSNHYSMLCPVAEALLSALFPFQWVGLYIPVTPLSMLDILDAPVPYLVGFDSQYLHLVDIKHRPNDVVFVDLDRDVLLMGDVSIPRIPHRDALKLMTALEEAGGSTYIIPNSGIKGCIMSGSEEALLVPNEERPKYAHMTTMTALDAESLGRRGVFSTTDLAYGSYESDHAGSISGFGSTHGQMTLTEETATSDGRKNRLKFSPIKPIKKPKFMRNVKADILSNSNSAMNQGHLLDIEELDKFSVKAIRKAFLRFTVATFARYEEFLLSGEGSALFDDGRFINEQRVDGGSTEFLRNILDTQLFQRFMEERKDNPEIPEIRFFDESIIAKMNRSKKASLANGGKKPTPFLNDASWKVTKSFTPPSPSNLGLPDTGETYSYGTFPSLDYTLFGRIRAPVTWRQETNRESLRVKYTPKNCQTKRTQMEIVKKALKPIMSAPNAIAAVAGRAAKDLDSALVAISLHGRHYRKHESDVRGEKITPPDRGVETLSKADAIMINARRKQVILLDVLIDLQAICRRFLARRYYLEIRNTAKVAVKNQRYAVERQLEVEASLKASELSRLKNTKSVIIQSVWRGYITRRRAQSYLNAAVKIQANQRAWTERRNWCTMKSSAVRIQSKIKARRLTNVFSIVKQMITKIQAQVRGMLIRKRVNFVKTAKLALYRSQIFVLWTFAHVPLALRTKMWPDLNSGENFLRLRLAESELKRLWEIVGYKSNASGLKLNDKITRVCKGIGFDNEIYRRSKQCVDWINSNALSSCMSPIIETALEIEETERLQIYERLNAMSEKEVLALYGYFGIPSDEKLKKVSLSQTIWTKLALANRSTSTMTSLFPELVNSVSIVFQTPSAKGLRRFPRASKSPLPSPNQILWNEVSVEMNVKKHVQEVGLLYITKVPSLLRKLDHIGDPMDSKTKSFQIAVTKAYNQPWKSARRKLIMSYLEVRYTETCSPRVISSGAEQKAMMFSPEISLAVKSSTPAAESVHFPIVPIKPQTGHTRSGQKGRNFSNPFDTEYVVDTRNACNNGDATSAFADIDTGSEKNDGNSVGTMFPDLDLGRHVKGGFPPDFGRYRMTRVHDDVRDVEFPDIDSARETKAKGDFREVSFPAVL